MRNFNNVRRVALLPLDNRPPNYQFPAQFAQIAGAELLLPPREFLGDAQRGAQRDGLVNWLRNLPQIDALIVSLDALIFGGLSQSRQLSPPISAEKEQIKVLLSWREKRPETPICAFSVLMRLGISVITAADAVNHANLQRYSRLVDEAPHFDSQYLREQLEELTAQISPKTLQKYLQMRARNHQFNIDAVHLLEKNAIDFLCLAQEDCAEFGLHRAEQQKLLTLADELNLQSKISLHSGTDEVSMALLARLISHKSTFSLHWSEPDGADRIAAFEGNPCSETLHAQLQMMGCTAQDDSADFQLFINAPQAYSRQQQTQQQLESRTEILRKMVDEMEECLRRGQRVAVCDVAFPNGADDALLSILDKRGILGKLAAFAGWNTASNTIGTVIAQCVAFAAGNFAAEKKNQQFTAERILDDWIYQTRLRPQTQRQARAAGVSSLDFGAAQEDLRHQLERELRGYGQLIARRHFGATLQDLQVDFPWNRAFEIALKIRT